MTKYEACDVGKAGWKRCVFVKWKTVLHSKDRAAGQHRFKDITKVTCHTSIWFHVVLLTLTAGIVRLFAPHSLPIVRPFLAPTLRRIKHSSREAEVEPHCHLWKSYLWTVPMYVTQTEDRWNQVCGQRPVWSCRAEHEVKPRQWLLNWCQTANGDESKAKKTAAWSSLANSHPQVWPCAWCLCPRITS